MEDRRPSGKEGGWWELYTSNPYIALLAREVQVPSFDAYVKGVVSRSSCQGIDGRSTYGKHE